MTASGLRELLSGNELTATEVEVLRLASLGNTAKETAAIMWLSPETIKDYRKKATAKLDGKNLTQAVGVAIRTGLIT